MIRVQALLLAAALLPAAAQAARDGGAAPDDGDVPQLIAELGSDQYAVRRRAEELLLRLGPEAFDALKAAEDHEDPEIAERVRYIVQQMRVPWIRPEDPPEVRRLLTRFADLSEAGREERILELAALPDHAGLAPLCRIARYDHSPLAARRAATAILKLDLPAEARHAAAAKCRQELGASQRAPAEWIRLYLRELDEPRDAVAAWAAAARAEAELFQSGASDTEAAIAEALLQRLRDRCLDLQLADETAAAVLQLIELTASGGRAGQLSYNLIEALRWIIQREAWDALGPVEERYSEEFRRSRGLLYYLAVAVGRAGRDERAAELAEQAFAMKADDDEQRLAIAQAVANLGRVDWAEREYRRAIDGYPLVDPQSMEARSELAIWLHDRGEYQAAADLLGEFCDAVEADPAARQRLIEDVNADGSSGRELLGGVIARREFYLACVAETQQDYDRQRAHLETAANAYDKDPDILIAMYRVPGSDEDFMRRTRARIRRASQYVQTLIDEYPEIPSFYNQWAWLIANTEGDQQLAVKYSHRSLELSPNEPSYLDTLGRCYYAVGDLENAVKYQRQAVALAPHFRVMQRQLEQFETALAEQQRATADD